MNQRNLTDSIAQRIELGSGIRVQRALEAVLLLTAIFTSDVRLVWAGLVIFALQVVSPRLALFALAVALFRPSPKQSHISDIYNDFQGVRGSCAVSFVMLSLGLLLLHGGQPFGWVFVACPTASCLLAPTVGFCAGCTCYVVARDLASRAKIVPQKMEGASDVDLEPNTPRHQ